MSKLVKYRSNPVVSFKDEEEEGAVLYNPDKDKCVVVNAVGSTIWLYLEEPRTLDEIASMITNTFSGVDTDQAEKDLALFISKFEEGFINEVS